MFETSQEEIQKQMLDNVSDEYQKTIGFPTYDILRAVSFAFEPFYKALDTVYYKTDIYNLYGEELERYTKQRKNIVRKEATTAKVVLTITGNGTVTEEDLFETPSGTQFIALDTVVIDGTGMVNAEAVKAGKEGNVAAGTIIQIPKTIQGITGCTNKEAAAGGYDAETDESLRERYLEAVRKPPTSGNKYHYIMWAKEVPGVGDAKAFPLWAGDNTVKVVIINDQMQPADTELIERVQDHIDPEGKGTGEGQAPIGAYCTVTSATGKNITISVSVQLLSGFEKNVVEENIKKGITNYLKSIAFAQDYVSYGKIANEINDAEGVKDYSSLYVNGGTGNIEIGEEDVAILGEVTIVV